MPFVEVAGRIVPSLPVAAALAAGGIAPDQVSASRAALVLGATRVPWVEQVVPDYYGPAQTVWRGLVPFRGPTMRADRTPTFPSYSFQDVFLAEQQTPGRADAASRPGGVQGSDRRRRRDRRGPEGHLHHAVRRGHYARRRVPRQRARRPAGESRDRPGRAVAARHGDSAPALAVSTVGALAAPGRRQWRRWRPRRCSPGYTTRALGQGLWLPLVVPVLAALLAFVADLAWSYFVEGREKRRVKRLFSRYVSRDVYQQLLASPDDIGLGGERREMTVLFSDMRGFTTLSESGEAEDLVRQLNQYFTRMVEVVFAHRGTVDKFVGDMVMALFGAPLDDPDHADHAVQTALKMVDGTTGPQPAVGVEGRAALDIGIGINTGEMIAGNIGSDTIMSYTVIGDNVNLGARLESLNKDFATRILISEATRRQLKGHYDVRPLGEVTVKGKTRPVAIFEVRADVKKEASI